MDKNLEVSSKLMTVNSTSGTKSPPPSPDVFKRKATEIVKILVVLASMKHNTVLYVKTTA